jgi:hypothetical protein
MDYSGLAGRARVATVATFKCIDVHPLLHQQQIGSRNSTERRNSRVAIAMRR